MNFNGPEKFKNTIEQKRVTSFETGKGSVYSYLPDGRTVRFKKVENKEYEPQDVVVFIPDWKTLVAKAPPEFLSKFGNNETEFEQELLRYSKNCKIYVIDDGATKISSNQEAQNAGKIFCAFCKTPDSKPDFLIPALSSPKENYIVYDTRKYYDEDKKQWLRDQHIGNAVVKINYQ